jgi:cardiolipin synthase
LLARFIFFTTRLLIVPQFIHEWKTGFSLAWSGYIAVLSIWIVMQKRALASTMSWILSLALLPFAGFVTYYFFGPQRLKKQRLKRLPSRASADATADLALLRAARQQAPTALRRMASLGAATCGLPMSSATEVELLTGGARTFDAIFEAIRNARDHADLEYYIVKPDTIGTALRDLLVQKAQQGAAVRLLLVALGSKRVGRRLRPVTNYRTHRKIVVCDGLTGFTGGVNITDEEDKRTCALKAVPSVGCKPRFLKTGRTPLAKTRETSTTRYRICCHAPQLAIFRCKS